MENGRLLDTLIPILLKLGLEDVSERKPCLAGLRRSMVASEWGQESPRPLMRKSEGITAVLAGNDLFPTANPGCKGLYGLA